MKFVPTEISGACLVELEKFSDDRGCFARSFCVEEFVAHGLPGEVRQCNVSYNVHAGTLRGLHTQTAPHAESKLVRCTRGRIFDVVVDLRPESPTFRQWVGAELSCREHQALFVPEGCLHGFQTLEDDSEVFYVMFADYAPDCQRGYAWNDPAFGVDWPLEVTEMSDRDRDLPRFDP